MTKKMTTITITPELHDRLEQLKVHEREPFYSVIKRLLDEYKEE